VLNATERRVDLLHGYLVWKSVVLVSRYYEWDKSFNCFVEERTEIPALKILLLMEAKVDLRRLECRR